MLDDAEEVACARCHRITPVDTMRLWTTRERVRTLSRTVAPPPTADAPPTELGLDRRATRPGSQSGPRSGPQSGALADAGPRPPAFRYAGVTRADAVCPACHDKLTRGAALDGPERWRTWLTVVAFLVIAAALVWAVPAFLPNLTAAFWRNGAGGR